MTRSSLALLLLLVACAHSGSNGSGSSGIVWYTTDGEVAEPSVVRAAARRCETEMDPMERRGLFRGGVEWGVRMLNCLRGEGYVMMTDDPENRVPVETAE